MKRKGFTLVELLAVIVILAVIALIAVPMILGVIEKSRRGALQNSGYGLVEAGTLYYAEVQNSKTIRFDIKDNDVASEEENKLVYKGFIKEGTVLINNKGKVVVCINDGKYAAYKNFDDNKVTIVDNKTCTVPENSNIVYLDNEATIDTNINDLIARIEELEATVSNLEKEKISELEVTNQITNLTTIHNSDITKINNNLQTLENKNSILNSQMNHVTYQYLTLNQQAIGEKNFKQGNVVHIQLYFFYSIKFDNGTSIGKVPDEWIPSQDTNWIPCGIAYSSGSNLENNHNFKIYARVTTNGDVMIASDFGIPMYGPSLTFSYLVN